MPENSNQDKVSNYSFEFDGVDDYIDTGITTLTGIDFSISYWFKTTATLSNFNYYVPFSANTNYQFTGAYLYFLGTLTVASKNSTGTVIKGTVDLSDGNWHHIVVTYNASSYSLKMYVDGSIDYDETISSINVFNQPLRLGGKTSTQYLINCSIDEASYFNSELTSANVTTLYNSGVPADISSLSPTSWWRMGEEATFTDNWLVNNSALDNYSTRSFNFDGIDDYIELDSSVSFANEFTISVWVKPNGFSTSQTIVGMGSSSKNWLRLSSASQITFRINATSLTFTDVGNNLVDGVWQHLLIYRDSSNNVGIFRNGTAFSTTQSNTNTLTLITIGKRGNLEYTGSLDEIAFWTSDQSSNVSSIYNGGEPADLTSLSPISWWRMGEDATFDSSTNEFTVPDKVGSNDGTSSNTMLLETLVGDAPNYIGGGLSSSMTIENRVGEAPSSTSNALSYNMDEADRETDVPS